MVQMYLNYIENTYSIRMLLSILWKRIVLQVWEKPGVVSTYWLVPLSQNIAWAVREYWWMYSFTGKMKDGCTNDMWWWEKTVESPVGMEEEVQCGELVQFDW